MKTINNSKLLFKFASKVRAVNRENGSYHSYVNKIAQHEITKSHQYNDGSITQLHFLKIQWYMVTNLYLGELLAELRLQNLSLNENRSLIYLGALMAITDLMVDDHQLGHQRVSLLLNGETNERNRLTAIEKVFILYYEKLLLCIDDKKKRLIKNFAMLKPQTESHLQLKEHFSEAAIHKLTREKGGTAILLTASLLFEISEKNKAAFYQLGAFIQYLNDSQDVYKDLNAGVTTFVSFCHSFSEVNAKLKQEFEHTTTLMLQTDFSHKNLYKLLFNLHAMYVGILYKNKVFARKLGDTIDADNIRLVDKTTFRAPMFSVKSVVFCLPRILLFKIPNL
ncbi:MAG: hypothetical protein KQH67_09810 [Bacteroidetes bacterium]|nr:hypothetical protein [Bacteroidota bacterium]